MNRHAAKAHFIVIFFMVLFLFFCFFTLRKTFVLTAVDWILYHKPNSMSRQNRAFLHIYFDDFPGMPGFPDNDFLGMPEFSAPPPNPPPFFHYFYVPVPLFLSILPIINQSKGIFGHYNQYLQ